MKVMKQYLIDGLRPEDHEKLKQYLDQNYGPAVLGNIYWIELKTNILTSVQKEHSDCRPHIFALELENSQLSCELLVRIKKNIKCDCMGYATPGQREWLIENVDAMLDELGISI